MIKKVTILGATGSIGLNTIEVLEKYKDKFALYAISCDTNIKKFYKIVERLNPAYGVITNTDECLKFKSGYNGTTEILCGVEGIDEIIERDETDIYMNAISGFAGGLPTLKILNKRKKIALANKESLVIFGVIIDKESYEYIIPIDSEHNAIYQCLKGELTDSIERVILTASGGPFWGNESDLTHITIKDALNHPTWNMGKKITIDSATMMNKGYEIIEAHYLFNLPEEKIDVLIHPQSIVHSFVEFKDYSVKALLSKPDMKLPIEYALLEEEHGEAFIEKLDLSKICSLNFYKPDEKTFCALRIARDCLNEGGTMPAVLNAADEVAVYRFIKGEIGFLDILKIVEKTLDKHNIIRNPGIEDILEVNKWAQQYARGVKL